MHTPLLPQSLSVIHFTHFVVSPLLMHFKPSEQGDSSQGVLHVPWDFATHNFPVSHLVALQAGTQALLEHFSSSLQSASVEQTFNSVLPPPVPSPPKVPPSFSPEYFGAEVTPALLPSFTAAAIVNVLSEKMPEVSAA